MVSVMSRLSFILFLCFLAFSSTTARVASVRGRNLGVGLVSTDAPVIEDVSTDAPVEEEEPEEVDEQEDQEPEEDEVGSIAAVGTSDPDLSILVELITIAGLGPVLESPGPFTVFAPTNDAFAEVIADLDNLDALETDVIIEVLSYHVVGGTIMSSDITDGMTLDTVQGESIEFHITDAGVFVNEEAISAVDISASNGVVHKIDGVMFPQSVLDPTEAPAEEDDEEAAPAEETGSIAAVGTSDPELSILVELVTLAGLGPVLESPGPFTVFAPTNDAFAEVIVDLDSLEILDTDVVIALLSYHVVPGIYMSTDISDGLILGTVQGETIEFHVNDDGVFVNEETISAVDITASNGVVHKIDGVMFPQAILAPTEAPTEGAEEEEAAPAEEVGSIAAVGASDPDLSILVELVTLANLGAVLESPGPFTVFAPTNDAFAEVIVDVESLEILDTNVIIALLSYHVVPGIYMSTDISDGLILGTVQGETIEFHVTDDGVTVNEETISAVDITASNGVVHKIDGVMFPQAILAPTEAPTGAPEDTTAD